MWYSRIVLKVLLKRSLREWDLHCALVPLTKSNFLCRLSEMAIWQFGKRAFSVCGPVVWNSLPTVLRNIDSYPSFRRALKSHLFSCAYSSQLLSNMFTDIVMHSRPCFCRLGSLFYILLYCIVLYCNRWCYWCREAVMLTFDGLLSSSCRRQISPVQLCHRHWHAGMKHYSTKRVRTWQNT